jgi:hypothetical protein
MISDRCFFFLHAKNRDFSTDWWPQQLAMGIQAANTATKNGKIWEVSHQDDG